MCVVEGVWCGGKRQATIWNVGVSACYHRVEILALLLIPASCCRISWEAEGDGLCTQVFATCVENLN